MVVMAFMILFLKGELNRARMQGNINTWGHHPLRLHALIHLGILHHFHHRLIMMTELVWIHGSVTGGGRILATRADPKRHQHEAAFSTDLT